METSLPCTTLSQSHSPLHLPQLSSALIADADFKRAYQGQSVALFSHAKTPLGLLITVCKSNSSRKGKQPPLKDADLRNFSWDSTRFWFLHSNLVAGRREKSVEFNYRKTIFANLGRDGGNFSPDKATWRWYPRRISIVWCLLFAAWRFWWMGILWRTIGDHVKELEGAKSESLSVSNDAV
jgi:hypothetical protein